MKILWEGNVDNRELAGIANGDRQPMRVVEEGEGRLMTEFAGSVFADPDTESEVAYTDEWYADSSIRFRDMDPAPDAALVARLVEQGLVEA